MLDKPAANGVKVAYDTGIKHLRTFSFRSGYEFSCKTLIILSTIRYKYFNAVLKYAFLIFGFINNAM